MEQASLNIGTIGQRLEAARQAKGVTVSEAGRATKILSKFIEAMEADDFGALSAPVYAKSFLRMYAKYLGMDDHPLVDEYVAQHAPKSKTQLSDETRQNLVKADQAPDDAGNVPASSAAPQKKGKGPKAIFGDINTAVTDMSKSALPVKAILSAVGGILLIILIALAVTQCAGDDATEPTTAGGAASVEHSVISDGVPDAYLAKPGVVDVDKN
ncbi:MAG: helix-turn-helix transcriptional regulator [Pontiella sp.]